MRYFIFVVFVAFVASVILAVPLTKAAVAGVSHVSLKLTFKIGDGDTVYVGDTRDPGSGTWYENNLTKRMLCGQNNTVGSKPVSVTGASGGGFRSLKYTSGTTYTVELLQDYGEPFYLFFTDVNCTPAINNAPAVERGRVAVQGTEPVITPRGLLAWIPYPTINLTQSLRLPGGSWELLVENNGTKKNVTQVKISVV